MGSMYTACLFLGVQNAASVQPVVAVERTVFYRETAAGMYSALPYALAQVINLLKLCLLIVAVFCLLVYIEHFMKIDLYPHPHPGFSGTPIYLFSRWSIWSYCFCDDRI